MKNIFLIFICCVGFLNPVALFAQKNGSNAKSDSIKLARQLIKDSILKKQDSIYLAREEAKEKRQREIEKRKEQLFLKQKKKVSPLTQEICVGYRFNSDGFSFFSNRGFIKNEDVENVHTNFIWFDFSEKHHPKEYRSYNENFVALNPNELKPIPYKYGKINNFYQFKIGYGNMKPISGFLDKKNVIIHWVYGAGISFGLLKPYYLDLIVKEGGGFIRKFEKYSEENKEYFLDLSNQGYIIGGSSFTKGIGETKIRPGLALKSGFFFDYSKFKKTFMGVEIGATAEIYMQEIPIMAVAKNHAYFINVYADFRFGKRWE